MRFLYSKPGLLATALLVAGVIGVRAAPRAANSAGQPLPPPFKTPPAFKHARIIAWPQGRTPRAPRGFKVNLFAAGLDYGRKMTLLPNGDVLVSEARTISAPSVDRSRGKSADRLTLLRDANHDGVAEKRFVLANRRNGLRQPFGTLYRGGFLYVANTDGVLRFPFRPGQTRLTARGTLVARLPSGGYYNHWTRNLLASRDNRKLYVSIGSATNAGERGDPTALSRAAIWQMNFDGTARRVFANGLRNPVGLAWNPRSGRLWTVVNERDGLGDNLVPDYLAQVKEGGFYGWPYAYANRVPEPRLKGKRPDLVAKSLAPDFSLAPHSASLDLLFYGGNTFPAAYRGGAFVSQHGSWNRSKFTGYGVAFVPFATGRPSGPAQPFLTGFVASESKSTAYGRPACLLALRDGSLLVSDDAANRIWRVSYAR